MLTILLKKSKSSRDNKFLLYAKPPLSHSFVTIFSLVALLSLVYIGVNGVYRSTLMVSGSVESVGGLLEMQAPASGVFRSIKIFPGATLAKGETAAYIEPLDRVYKHGHNVFSHQSFSIQYINNKEINASNKYLSSIESTKSYRKGFPMLAQYSGVVGYVNVLNGMYVKKDQDLFSIKYTSNGVGLVLYVPEKNIDEVNIGSKVIVKINAYPYQQYGVVYGRVYSISNTAKHLEVGISRNSKQADKFFTVRAQLNNQYVGQGGRKRQLLKGMSITAEIIGREMPIYRMLFTHD